MAVAPAAHERTADRYLMPKLVIFPQGNLLICIDNVPTVSSMQLRDSLRQTFPHVLVCDVDKRLVQLMNSKQGRKYFVVVVGPIRQSALDAALADSRVSAIYFVLQSVDVTHSIRSKKVRGIFDDELHLKQTIYFDVRLANM
jgi:hypothetical protein